MPCYSLESVAVLPVHTKEEKGHLCMDEKTCYFDSVRIEYSMPGNFRPIKFKTDIYAQYKPTQFPSPHQIQSRSLKL